MPMIGPDELPELDQKLSRLVEQFQASKKPEPQDIQYCRELLDWLIYEGWEDAEELDVRPIAWSDCLSERERQNLANLALAAQQFVASRAKDDKATVLEIGQAVLNLRGVSLVDRNKPKDILDKKTEARDRYVYERLSKGQSAARIVAAIEQHPEWDILPADQLESCAEAYAQRHQLPSLEQRRRTS